jgi:hypothetical protein
MAECGERGRLLRPEGVWFDRDPKRTPRWFSDQMSGHGRGQRVLSSPRDPPPFDSVGPQSTLSIQECQSYVIFYFGALNLAKLFSNSLIEVIVPLLIRVQMQSLVPFSIPRADAGHRQFRCPVLRFESGRSFASELRWRRFTNVSVQKVLPAQLFGARL